MSDSPEILALIQSLAQDLSGSTLTLIGVLTLFAKYTVDLLRTKVVQAILPVGMQWDTWSPTMRQWIAIGQSFLVTLLPALTVTGWGGAITAALLAAFGAKGVHDTGLLPGKRPTPPPPSLSRAHSLRTRPPTF